MPTLRLQHPGGKGETRVQVDAEGHEVWVRFPIRTQYGAGLQLGRFQPAEAIALAELLVDEARDALAAPPTVE